MTELDKDTFDAAVLAHKGVYLVDFWSETCETCAAMMPEIETLERELAGKADLRQGEPAGQPPARHPREGDEPADRRDLPRRGAGEGLLEGVHRGRGEDRGRGAAGWLNGRRSSRPAPTPCSTVPHFAMEHGTTPANERAANPGSAFLEALPAVAAVFAEVAAYPPNLAFIGTLDPREPAAPAVDRGARARGRPRGQARWRRPPSRDRSAGSSTSGPSTRSSSSRTPSTWCC